MDKEYENLINTLKNSERYKNFTFLQNPEPFDKLFDKKPYTFVQIHDMTPAGDDIVGFAGICSWDGKTLIAADGDSYTKDMTVCGFSEFKDENKNLCLDILSNNW